ncbi:hypothetical protein FF80_01972 [Devosia sp. LC5]|uniref:DUF4432 family protein n=1 Tax=Devosia sp. LC5 TaxID=1502724 RepID=UPI0004E2D3A5|nr:DUF4432 family protein [Devosia sp. LC5]KFC68248.1 hypothetical protein FF80_01972 [Devosia sp. LC5]
MRQASIFGETLELHRRITLPLDGTQLRAYDRVASRGFRPTRHALLYHFNFGYTFLDKGLEVVGLPAPLLGDMRADSPVPGDIGERVPAVDTSDVPADQPDS